MAKLTARITLAASMLAGALGTSHAALIGFDDQEITHFPGSIWDPYVEPLDPQAYAAQGVTIEGGWLWPADYNTSQSMRVSDDTRITFAGASLPTHVSLHVRWLPEDVLDIRAAGPGGYSTAFHSFGYENGPSVPGNFGNQRISFSSASGIASLSFADSRFMRFPAWVDNIYFGNTPAVPEPLPLALFGVGALVLWGRHRRTARA